MSTDIVSFSNLALIDPLLRALTGAGYERPTPIQAAAIPPVLAGRDLCGTAQTGTGKTAAFALPILQQLSATRGAGGIRALILSPTRELAAQIGDSFRIYGQFLKIRHTVAFGGVGQGAQERALKAGVDVLIACPGRLLDLMGQGLVKLDRIEIFVLDEADRMLDMGFIHDVRRVVSLLPRQRQTLLFSATMPRDIEELAATMLKTPARVSVAPPAATADRVRQSVQFVDKASKRAALQRILDDPRLTRVIVFTRTKHGANRVAEALSRAAIGAEAIHGNKSQNARERALANFKSGVTRVLVATDIAARGIHVDGVSHVINFDLPEVAETYVHRIGRTARADADGEAISLCDGEERGLLREIEKLTRQRIPELRA